MKVVSHKNLIFYLAYLKAFNHCKHQNFLQYCYCTCFNPSRTMLEHKLASGFQIQN